MNTRTFTISGISGRYNTFPFIRICGRWLAKAGFNYGDKIQVTVAYEKLIITKLTSEEGSKLKDEMEDTKGT